MTAPPAGQLRLGWQYATAFPDPGPPPRRPTPPEAERLGPDWAAAQRREENLINRPLKAACAVSVTLGVTLIALGAAGSFGAVVAGLAVTSCTLVAAVSGYGLWQGERALRSRMADERARIGRIRAEQESRLFAGQAEHATRMREWQRLRLACERQKRWYAIRVPENAARVDIAGGTLGGWSAMLTTAAAGPLAAGGEITVLDLTGGAVALDLIGFARACGTGPLVWVLPGDLPRLGLAGGLGVAGDLGREAGPVPLPRGGLRVIALDRRAGAASSPVLGPDLAAGLTGLLRGTGPGHPGPRLLFVLGADQLPGDTLDRLTDACDRSAIRLVLAYRGIPAHVRPRLGRGNAVLAVMRPAGAEDARAASEQLGAGHRFALARLTETIGGSVADPAAGAYASTAAAAGEVATGTATASAAAGPRPEGGPFPMTGGSEPVIAAIRASTGWGTATARAASDGESPARALERSRELGSGPDELRQLPVSAMIVSSAGPDGRQVVLADVNPGIGGLSAATELTLEEYRARPADEPPDPAGSADGAISSADGGASSPDGGASSPDSGSPSPPPGQPAPNIGPPPRRLDWRRGRF